MFNSIKKTDALIDKSRILMAFVVVLSVINISMIVSISNLPKKFQFYITPSLYDLGGEIKAEHIPSETVFTFASSIIPYLHTWQKSSPEKIKEFIHQNQFYFSARHQGEVEKTFDVYNQTNMYERSQLASLYRQLEDSDVQKISDNLWVVNMQLRLVQRLNDNDEQIISDKVIEMKVRVMKSEVSRTLNRFGLMIDGYQTEDKIVKDMLGGN